MKTNSTLKRTGFKRKATKPRKPLKRGAQFKKKDLMEAIMTGKAPIRLRKALKKKSPAKISVLKRKLWTVFSAYIRKRDKGICFTCGRKCEGSGYHAGHFISKAIGGVLLYFHPENVRGQCYNCNINLGGAQWEYGQRLGKEKVDQLYALKNSPPQKWDAERYEFEIRWYTQLLSELD